MSRSADRLPGAPSRRDVLRVGAGAAALAGLGGCGEKAVLRSPNVLLVLASGWRGQDLGFLGTSPVRTPHLDRLAAEGVHVAQAFANTPLAAPSRASLWSGRYALQHGVVGNSLVALDAGVPTLARTLTTRGWRCSYVGTWRLGGYPESSFVPPGPARHGFDEYWAQWLTPFSYYDSAVAVDDEPPRHVPGYAPFEQRDLALERLDKHVASGTADPFLLAVSFGPPHPPADQVPAEFLEAYDPAALALRPNFEPSAVAADTDEVGIRARYAKYLAACSALDACVGALLERLERHGIADDTIVVFLSDHGTHFGEHGLTASQQPFEEAVRVPLVVRWPRGLRRGAWTDVLFSMVDVAPTLLGLCEAPVPSTMEGRDLGFALHGNVGREPESVYLQEVLGIGPSNLHRTFSWRALRTKDRLYAEDLGGPWLLYDLARDPYELENLVADSASREERDLLAEELRRWYARLGERYRTPLAHLEDLGLAERQRSILNQQIAGATRTPAARVLRAYLSEGSTWTNPPHR